MYKIKHIYNHKKGYHTTSQGKAVTAHLTLMNLNSLSLSRKDAEIGTHDTKKARLVLEQTTPQVKTAGINKVLDEDLNPVV